MLLISVDGLHSSDLAQWIAQHPTSSLAALSGAGTTYANALAPDPSDSFPGLLAQLTGGTAKSTGVYYDNSYARDFWAPGTTTCSPATQGATALFDESVDQVDSAGFRRINAPIDPSLLPVGGAACKPVVPGSSLRTNTIFNVARAKGLYTAWADKHAAYQIVDGPSGVGTNDLYTPDINFEVNSETVDAGGYALNVDGTRSPLKLPFPRLQIPDSVANTSAYDQIKVDAVRNEIDGWNALHTARAPVPAIFGMNFQSVSVGQKLVDPLLSCPRSGNAAGCDPHYIPGGYQPGSLAFTPQLERALAFIDGAVGSLAQEVRSKGLWGSTEIIISAKHGQSPIDPTTLAKIGDPISAILSGAGVGVAQETTDDISLIWLKDHNQTGAAVAALNADRAGANTARIQYVLSGPALAARFNNPTRDPRTPDIIVQPVPGTIYSHSKAKVAEHGGFALDDTHVGLLVINGADSRDVGDNLLHGLLGLLGPLLGHGHPGNGTGGQVVTRQVHTTQIAPTILSYLELNPRALQAVRAEGTQALPASR
ncbi:MAG: alkaline phosphatase family protein [Actinomycetota bacterium]